MCSTGSPTRSGAWRRPSGGFERRRHGRLGRRTPVRCRRRAGVTAERIATPPPFARDTQPGPFYPSPPGLMVVSTPFLPGYRIVNTIGFTWGLVVRSRGLGGNIMAGLRTIPGGEIPEYTQMLDQARYDALMRLMEHARSLGAIAVIGARFDPPRSGRRCPRPWRTGSRSSSRRTNRRGSPSPSGSLGKPVTRFKSAQGSFGAHGLGSAPPG